MRLKRRKGKLRGRCEMAPKQRSSKKKPRRSRKKKHLENTTLSRQKIARTALRQPVEKTERQTGSRHPKAKGENRTSERSKKRGGFTPNIPRQEGRGKRMLFTRGGTERGGWGDGERDKEKTQSPGGGRSPGAGSRGKEKITRNAF